MFALFHDVFTDLPDAWTWLAYAVSLILAFLIGFYFEACIGISGFWLLEITSFAYIINIFNFFVSGQMFPLELLEQYPLITPILRILPFQYLAYFPAMVFLGKKTGDELIVGLGIELAWAVGLMLLSRWMYRLGLRHYSAYGG